jgi:hypothetical protein
MKDIIKKVKNDKGIIFNVKIYKDKIEKDWFITFYDSRYKAGFNKLGQGICSYYVGTILNRKGYYGNSNKDSCLNLYGGESDWYIDNKPYQKLVKFLKDNIKIKRVKNES